MNRSCDNYVLRHLLFAYVVCMNIVYRIGWVNRKIFIILLFIKQIITCLHGRRDASDRYVYVKDMECLQLGTFHNEIRERGLLEVEMCSTVVG